MIMQSTQPSPEQTAPRRFRAATIDEALEAARRELGPDIELVEANRIRRGGVGGFFATELGVEIVVDVPPYFAGATATGKPHFYDRVVEEEIGAPSGLDRLIENAARAERVANRDVATAGGSSGDDRTAHDLSSFAEHFAREMSEHVPSARPEVPQPTAAPPARDLDELAELPRARRIAPEPSPQPAVEPAVERPVERAPRTRRSERKAPASAAKRDPLRRPSELAAAAASRLISDLAEVVARDGSRVEDLARLRVSITTPDGAVIELTAEMDGRDRA